MSSRNGFADRSTAPVIDLTSDDENEHISPEDTGYLKVDLVRLDQWEKRGKLSHVKSFPALFHVLRSRGDSWLYDLDEPDWSKCIFTSFPGASRPKAAELKDLKPPGNSIYFVGGAAVVDALLRTADYLGFSEDLLRRLRLCHPNYRPSPTVPQQAPATEESVPTVSSLTMMTSSTIDICYDTPYSDDVERAELESFLSEPPLVLEEPVSAPTKLRRKELPFYCELRKFQEMLRSSSLPLFRDFEHFFKRLKKADSKWRVHSSVEEDETINVYVRASTHLPARDYSKGSMAKDVDYFVGEDRLLQYCALRCLRLGDITVCKAIAKLRMDMFYPGCVSGVDWNTRQLVPSSSSSTYPQPSMSSSSSSSAVTNGSSSSSSSSSSCNATNAAASSQAATSVNDEGPVSKAYINELLEEFSLPTALPPLSSVKDTLFYNEFHHLHGIFQDERATNAKKRSRTFNSFMGLYGTLREANERWRYVTAHDQQSHAQQTSKRKGYVVEVLDPKIVRVYCRRCDCRASEYEKQQKDVDYFMGDDRLLQYVGMQALQYGGVELAAELAAMRVRLRSGIDSFVDDKETPTEDSSTPETTRKRKDEASVIEDTAVIQTETTVLSTLPPSSPISSERSRKRRRESAPLHPATASKCTAQTQTDDDDWYQPGTTILQPPQQAPAKSAAMSVTLTALPQHLDISDEDSDAHEPPWTTPTKATFEPRAIADSKQISSSSFTRQRLMCAKSRDNRNLTFCDTK